MGRTAGLRSGRRPEVNGNGMHMAGQSHTVGEPAQTCAAPEPPAVEETATPNFTANANGDTSRRDASSLEPGMHMLAGRTNPTPPSAVAATAATTSTSSSSTTGDANATASTEFQGSVATRFTLAAQAAQAQEMLSSSASKEGYSYRPYGNPTTSQGQQGSQTELERRDLPEVQPVQTQVQPGAYTDTGMSLVRATSFRKTEFRTTQNEIYQDEEEGRPQPNQDFNVQVKSDRSMHTVVATEVPEGEQDHNNNHSGPIPTATGIDTEALQALQQRKEEEEKKTIHYARTCGFLVLVVIAILIIVVVAHVASTKATTTTTNSDAKSPSTSPSASPTRPMPPMENMESLYYSLPKKTKERLDDSSSNSPQRRAWEWLRNHPRVSAYPEWRKKQIFAMATFFYSFEGPNWPETTNGYGRWMNYDMEDECTWVLSKEEISFLFQENTKIVGPGSYSYRDFHPCNEHGELQTIIVVRLILPPDMRHRVSIPPEIGLLTSLKIFSIAFSQINAELSDLFSVPEFVNLPNLEAINLYKGGVTGSIPPEVFGMTNLRHIVFGGLNNMLENTIPTEIAKMSSLEYFNLYDVKGTMAGKLPSELGMMTTLTGLEVSWSDFSGTIPTAMGSLTNMRKLSLARNRFSGPIPSEMALMTGLEQLFLGHDMEDDSYNHNNFSGSLPSQLWSLSNMQRLYLADLPNVHFRIPTEIEMPNMTELWLGGSHLSGTIPPALCSVDDLKFVCSNMLCGCHCPCMNTVVQTNNFNHKYLP